MEISVWAVKLAMKASIFYMAEQYIPTALSAIFIFYFAAVADVEFVGKINYYLSIVGILSIFSLTSIDQLLQKEIVNNTTLAERYTNALISIKIVSAILVFLSGALISYLFIPADTVVFLILLSVLFANSLNTIRSVLIADNLYKKQISITLPWSIASFFLKMFLVKHGVSAGMLAFCFILDFFVVGGALFLWYVRNYSYKFHVDLEVLKYFWVEGKYLFMSGAVLLFYANIDKIIIGKFVSETELASYSVAFKLLSLYLIASAAFNLGFVRKLKSSSVDLNKHCKDMLSFSLLLGLCGTIVSYLLSPIIIEIIYPERYLDARDYVRYLSPLVFFSFLLSSTGRILVVKSYSKHAFKRNLYALVVNLTVSGVLVLEYGVSGVLVGVMLSFLVSSFLYISIVRELRDEFKFIILGR
ncbi:oligosaccharide flippase family protein [Pseudomonas saliphila]|uniref:oligosaccharide flippase family protein n=1 Tax=Pseudomonas saliphila TaxID=2586906 RepID=UPI00123B295B|nr:oligosaccharide flippase family protein [Pseudomonas saliphila]